MLAGEDVWIGSYAGPVADMIVRHNVFHNSTGYCNDSSNANALWPGNKDHYVPPPGAPAGIGQPSGHISVGEAGDVIGNGYLLRGIYIRNVKLRLENATRVS